MGDSTADLIPLLDRAIAECESLTGPEAVRPAVEARERLVTRSSYPDDVALVALAGGTGSGKSSLFNAIAGEELAVTGGLRRTLDSLRAVIERTRSDVTIAVLQQRLRESLDRQLS